jgi:hypothetical protein
MPVIMAWMVALAWEMTEVIVELCRWRGSYQTRMLVVFG